MKLISEIEPEFIIRKMLVILRGFYTCLHIRMFVITKFFINICKQCEMFVDEGIENKLGGPSVITDLFHIFCCGFVGKSV